MAIGLTGFTVAVLLGLVPVALSQVRDAGERQARAEILRQLDAAVRTVPWAQLDTYCQTPHFYDVDGFETVAGGDVAYEAELEPADVESVPGLRSVRVVLRSHPGRQPLAVVPLLVTERRGGTAGDYQP